MHTIQDLYGNVCARLHINKNAYGNRMLLRNTHRMIWLLLSSERSGARTHTMHTSDSNAFMEMMKSIIFFLCYCTRIAHIDDVWQISDRIEFNLFLNSWCCHGAEFENPIAFRYGCHYGFSLLSLQLGEMNWKKNWTNSKNEQCAYIEKCVIEKNHNVNKIEKKRTIWKWFGLTMET